MLRVAQGEYCVVMPDGYYSNRLFRNEDEAECSALVTEIVRLGYTLNKRRPCTKVSFYSEADAEMGLRCWHLTSAVQSGPRAGVQVR